MTRELPSGDQGFRARFSKHALGEANRGGRQLWPLTLSRPDKAYEVTADLPGLEEKNVEVKLSNGYLTNKGEKQDQMEETKKDQCIRERSFGSFERFFAVPEGVDTDKIEASFKNGVLTVSLPKTAEVQKADKKIEVKGA